MSAPSSLPAIASRLRPAADVVAGVRDYVALTRPRVLSLVLFTAPPALLLGHDGRPSPVTAASVLLGAALIGAGCGALNAWIEIETDGLMDRTRDRPLPAGRLVPHRALIFGLVISALGLLTLEVGAGRLAAGIGALTLAYYVFVYTLWLKPRTPQNIVLGGAAGAASPLIADAAVDGRLGLWGVALFAIVFLWTPPHFWAIALYRKREYEAAGFPMMPSVVGDAATRRRMLAYALALIPVSLAPWWSGSLSGAYAATALVMGAGFVASIARAMRLSRPQQDRRVFGFSILYLATLFGEMLLELTVF